MRFSGVMNAESAQNLGFERLAAVFVEIAV
jgi:hypothetical protein